MNASASDMEQTIRQIVHMADERKTEAKAVDMRAVALKTHAVEAKANALGVLQSTRVRLEQAMQDAKAVQEIATLTNYILDIAPRRTCFPQRLDRSGTRRRGRSRIRGRRR